MSSSFIVSERLQQLPPYLFDRIDQIKQEEQLKGKSLISLGIGDPDLPTPHFIIERLKKAVENPKNHQYPSYKGMLAFRQAICHWYQKRFNVTLDPEKQVLGLIGSKEGIAHLPLAFINPEDGVLVPDPSYPVYAGATLLAGGKPLFFPLLRKNGFLPKFSDLEKLLKSYPKTKLLFLNYPNNPTGACASLDFFKEVVKFAHQHEIIVCHDNAYSEIYFDNKQQPSFLQAPGALDVGCEFHSVSKTFNMTGWRVGFVVGHEKIISALTKVKTQIDSGIFNACQEAAIEALNHPEPFCTELRTLYQQRRDLLVPALQESGLNCPLPTATFYAWAKLPQGWSSENYVMHLIRSQQIVATPGLGFGNRGDRYVRFTFCSDLDILKKVSHQIKNFKIEPS